MTMKKRVKTWILVFFILPACFTLTEEIEAGGGGSVIINNRTSERVTILTLRIDAYGYRSWREIRVIPPGESTTLPGVPQNTKFGVKVGNNPKPPFTVEYPSKRQLFIYDVNP